MIELCMCTSIFAFLFLFTFIFVLGFRYKDVHHALTMPHTSAVQNNGACMVPTYSSVKCGKPTRGIKESLPTNPPARSRLLL